MKQLQLNLYPAPQGKEGFLQPQALLCLESALQGDQAEKQLRVPTILSKLCALVNAIQLMRKCGMSQEDAFVFYGQWEQAIPWVNQNFHAPEDGNFFQQPRNLDQLVDSQLSQRDEGFTALSMFISAQIQELDLRSGEKKFLLSYLSLALDALYTAWDETSLHFLAPLFSHEEEPHPGHHPLLKPSNTTWCFQEASLAGDFFTSDEEIDEIFGMAQKCEDIFGDSVEDLFGDCDEDIFGDSDEDLFGDCDEDLFGDCDQDLFGESQEETEEEDFWADWDEVDDDDDDDDDDDWEIDQEEQERREEMKEKKGRKRLMNKVLSSFTQEIAQRLEAQQLKNIFAQAMEETGAEEASLKSALKELHPEDYEKMKKAFEWD